MNGRIKRLESRRNPTGVKLTALESETLRFIIRTSRYGGPTKAWIFDELYSASRARPIEVENALMSLQQKSLIIVGRGRAQPTQAGRQVHNAMQIGTAMRR